MKKLLIIFLNFFLTFKAYALPLGNPAEASFVCGGLLDDVFCCGSVIPCDWVNIRLGYYGNFVFNRELQLQSSGHPKLETVELYTNAGYLALNFCNRVDIFAALGVTDLLLSANSHTLGISGPNNGPLVSELGSHFSYSVGARGTILSYCCTSLGAEIQYFHSCNKVRRITQFEEGSAYPSDLMTKYHEWQIGLGVAHQVAWLVPYAGVTWSNVKFVGPSVPDSNDAESAKHWGYAVGTTLLVCNAIALTVEGRFADEKAVYVNGQFRF